MANARKYTRAACGHLAAHYERRKDEKGEYVAKLELGYDI